MALGWVHERLAALDKELWPAVEQVAALEASLREARAQQRIAEQDRARLQLENGYLHLAVESVQASVAGVIDREDERRELAERVERLQAQQRQERETAATERAAVERATSMTVEALRAEIAALQAQQALDRVAADEQLRTAQAERDRSKRERDYAQGQRAELQKKLGSLETELKDLRDKYRAREQEHAEESLRLRHQLDEAHLVGKAGSAGTGAGPAKPRSKKREIQQIAKPVTGAGPAKPVASAAPPAKLPRLDAAVPLQDSQADFEFE